MKKFALSFALLAACGGSTATAPTPVTGTPAAIEAAPAAIEATPASTAATGPIPFDAWFVVRSTTGRGLSPGSGIAFHGTGYDVASGTLAQAMSGSCSVTAEGIDCDAAGATLHAVALEDGTVRVTQPPLELVLAPASAEQAATFTASLAAHQEQQAACRATADCCVDSENALGVPCDLNALVGARTAESCRAGLATLRSTLAGRSGELPASCR